MQRNGAPMPSVHIPSIIGFFAFSNFDNGMLQAPQVVGYKVTPRAIAYEDGKPMCQLISYATTTLPKQIRSATELNLYVTNTILFRSFRASPSC